MIRYYLLDDKNRRTEMFVAYSDIAAEFGTTRNSIAGKFYRAKHQQNSSIISVNDHLIERVVENN